MAVPYDFMPFGVPATDLRVGAFCHIFYADMTDAFFKALTQIQGRVDLMVSTDSEEKRIYILRVLNKWNKGLVEVRVAPNRGRDVGPRLTVFRDMHEKFDLIIYLQSKKGSQVVNGEEWRQYLFHNLVGSAEIIDSITETFRHGPKVGLIFSKHWEPVEQYINWGRNFAIAQRLAGRMGLSTPLPEDIDFPSGSMFWARPAALKPLLDLRLCADDFPPEAGQVDGTLAHAIERILLVACELAGYSWAKVCDPAKPSKSDSVKPISSLLDLDKFLKREENRSLGIV